MYVNVAVLKETHPHERRVALVPSVVGKLIKLGAKTAHAIGRGRCRQARPTPHSRMSSFIADRQALVGEADVVLAVQPPALDVINAMKEGAILISFIYAGKEAGFGEAPVGQEDHLLRHGPDPAHHAGAIYGRAIESVCLGGILRRATRRDPSGPRPAEDNIGCGRDRASAKFLVMGLGVAGLEAIATAHRLGAVVEGYDVRPETAEQVARWAPHSSRPAWMRAARAAMPANLPQRRKPRSTPS